MIGSKKEPLWATMARGYIEQKLPEILSWLFGQIVKFLEQATPEDIDRVAREMTPSREKMFRAFLALVKEGTP